MSMIAPSAATFSFCVSTELRSCVQGQYDQASVRAEFVVMTPTSVTAPSIDSQKAGGANRLIESAPTVTMSKVTDAADVGLLGMRSNVCAQRRESSSVRCSALLGMSCYAQETDVTTLLALTMKVTVVPPGRR